MSKIKLEKSSLGSYSVTVNGTSLSAKGLILDREEAILTALKHLDIKVELEQSYWIGGKQVDQILDLTS